ncbi:MAG: di-heme enzyme [Myxococcales bacterium]|nr:di-heme enzyme [Myxococcales bacterium]MCB9717081.1 di-heme enzyme [Myxococcales bacterium]
MTARLRSCSAASSRLGPSLLALGLAGAPACGDDAPAASAGGTATSEGTGTSGLDTTAGPDPDGTGESGDSGTGGDDSGYEWNLPPGFPAPWVPEDNPMTAEKVELGRHLFYDTRLSANETQSCGSCHEQELAFADGKTTPTGSTGQVLVRNSMHLTNAGYSFPLTWANPNLPTLEHQIMVPLFAEQPVELGASGHEDEILGRLRDDPLYQDLFAAAFPELDDPFSFERVRQALASFVRTMISGNSPFDRYTYQGDTNALTEQELRGLELFFSEALECHHCHFGFNFSGATRHAGTVHESFAYHNTGLYNLDADGAYPLGNQGLIEATFDPDDMGAFRAQTLRNIAVTGPYMHDGSVETLDEVIRIYERGGRLIDSGPNAGDGAVNPHKSGLVAGFTLTDQEREDLIVFLGSLTDDDFLTDPRFSNPFE